MTLKKRKKIKTSKNKSNLTKLASITTNTLSNAYSKYIKNLEKKKIKEIKLKKFEEKNDILKEQKSFTSLLTIFDKLNSKISKEWKNIENLKKYTAFLNK